MQKQRTLCKILLLYAKVGGGHESLAWGLKERLEQAFPNKLHIELIDPIAAVFNPAYQISTLINPKLYNFFYIYAQKSLSQKIFRKITSLIHDSKLQGIIEKSNPDLILSTHYFFSKEAKDAVAKYKKTVPVVLYNPDPYSPSHLWLRNVDLLLSYDLAHIQQADRFQIIPIGMPIRQAFYEQYNRQSVQQKLGLDPQKFTILFGGSGSGMDSLERIANGIADFPYDFQAIFACGRNVILEKALKIAFKKRPNIKVFGFITATQIAKLMQASDLFVGKAGPNVMCETIVSRLPMIATPPILGQEKGNRNFIQENNIGFLSNNSSQTLTLLRKILDTPHILDEQRKNIEKARKNLLVTEKKGFPQFIHWMKDNVEHL